MKTKKKSARLAKRALLWGEVRGKGKTSRVRIVGDQMPKELPDGWSWGLFLSDSYDLPSFKRYFGVTLPDGPGVYGLRVELVLVKRYRVVSEENYVAAKKTTKRLVRMGGE